jgi:hypothetical protein
LLGYTQSQADPCPFYKGDARQGTHLLFHFDDAFVMGSDKSVKEAIKTLAGHFEIRELGDARVFLGIQIEREGLGPIILHQGGFVTRFLKAQHRWKRPTGENVNSVMKQVASMVKVFNHAGETDFVSVAKHVQHYGERIWTACNSVVTLAYFGRGVQIIWQHWRKRFTRLLKCPTYSHHTDEIFSPYWWHLFAMLVTFVSPYWQLWSATLAMKTPSYWWKCSNQRGDIGGKLLAHWFDVCRHNDENGFASVVRLLSPYWWHFLTTLVR